MVVVVDEKEVEVEVEVHWVAERKINPTVSPTIQPVSGQYSIGKISMRTKTAVLCPRAD